MINAIPNISLYTIMNDNVQSWDFVKKTKDIF